MIRKILDSAKYIASIALLAIVILTGCRTNNGDIGPYYGLWILESLTVDGHQDTNIDCKDYSFRFQNNIVVVTQQKAYNDFINTYGTWEDRSGHLLLNFTHSYTDSDGSKVSMDPPAAIYLAPSAITDATIKHLTSKEMTLEFSSADGKVIGYSLRKLN